MCMQLRVNTKSFPNLNGAFFQMNESQQWPIQSCPSLHLNGETARTDNFVQENGNSSVQYCVDLNNVQYEAKRY